MMTKKEILDAAAEIFRIKGYHAASMSDIAGAVNLQKASLYHHVSSKQDILLELLDQALELLTERILPIAKSPEHSPDEKLILMVKAYLGALTEHVDLATVLLMEHRSLKPELRARHVPNRDRFEGIWREVIEEGLHKDVFSCIEAPLTARNILGSMNWTVTWYKPQGALSIDQIAEQMAGVFLNGIRDR